ncbi:MAG: hypothetical protein HMLKMBBP_01253 [Planctomycetes bacterium]|nr:hypothetical protein [Planctomycetota bacterium]
MRAVHLASSGVCFVFGLGAPALAQDKPPPTAREFDDGDGKMNEKELRAYLRWLRKYEVFSAIDTDRDGSLSGVEIDKFLADVDVGVDEALIDVEQRVNRLMGRPNFDETVHNLATEDLPVSLTVREVDRFLPLKWPESRWKIPDLYVRKSYDAITLADPAKPWDKATGLTLSFERNEREDKEKLAIDGAVIYVMTLSQPAPNGNSWVGRVSAAPSLSVERLRDDAVAKSERLTKDKNVFSTRLMFEAECDGLGPFATNYLRIAPGYATDSRLDADIGLVDVEWEPIGGEFGVGTPHRVFDAIDISVRTRMVGLVRHVSNPGFATVAAPGETDFRWGPKLELSVAPTAWPELGLTASYAHLESTSEDPQDLDRTTLGLKYDLTQNVGLSLEYTNGFKWVSLSEEETVKLGLSVKF